MIPQGTHILLIRTNHWVYSPSAPQRTHFNYTCKFWKKMFFLSIHALILGGSYTRIPRLRENYSRRVFVFIFAYLSPLTIGVTHDHLHSRKKEQFTSAKCAPFIIPIFLCFFSVYDLKRRTAWNKSWKYTRWSQTKATRRLTERDIMNFLKRPLSRYTRKLLNVSSRDAWTYYTYYIR